MATWRNKKKTSNLRLRRQSLPLLLASGSAMILSFADSFVIPSNSGLVITTSQKQQQQQQQDRFFGVLYSSPDEPGGWFESESSDIGVGARRGGGESLLPHQNDPFIASPGGFNDYGKARGVPSQQHRNQPPVSVSPFSWNGGEQAGDYNYAAGSRAYFPPKNKSTSKGRPKERRPVYPNVGGSSGSVREPVAERRPKIPNIPPPEAASEDYFNNEQQVAEEALLTPYQQWKLGDDRPRQGMGTYDSNNDGIGGTSNPNSSRRRRPTKPQSTRQSRPPPAAEPRIARQQQQQRSPSSTGENPNYPRRREQQPPPFEGRLTGQFSSTPDQPGAWFQSNASPPPPPRPSSSRIFSRDYVPERPPFDTDDKEDYEPRQQQSKTSRVPKIPYQPFSSTPGGRDSRSTKQENNAGPKQKAATMRRPKIPSAGPVPYQYSNDDDAPPQKQQSRRKPQESRVPPRTEGRRPRIPIRPEQRDEVRAMKKPKIPTASVEDSNLPRPPPQRREQEMPRTQPEPRIPFQIENEERYSTIPTPLQPEPSYRREEQEDDVQPQVQFQKPFREPVPPPPGGFPQPRTPTAAIQPLEPMVGGGSLGPATYSWDSSLAFGWNTVGRSSGYGPPDIGGYSSGRGPEEVIQGAGSRKTWETSHHDQTILNVGSEGRPVFANAQVWQGPGNTPASMSLYSEDGAYRPWRAAFQNTARSGGSSVLDVRNTGPMEFPMDVSVIGKHDGTKGMGKQQKEALEQTDPPGYDYKPSQYKVTQTVQGQSLKYFNVKAGVAAVMVELHSEGRPMFVQVELWQGPNSVKQCAEIYSDNGNDRHWSAIIDTHGRECTVAVRNVGPELVYPIKASVDPIPF